MGIFSSKYQKTSSTPKLGTAIKPFLGRYEDNVETFIEDIIEVKRQYELSDDETKKIMISKLQGKAKVWMSTRTHLNFRQLMEALVDNFQPWTVLPLETYDTFVRCKWDWRHNEKFATYFHDKLHLARGIAFTEHQLIERLIDGIGHRSWERQLRSLKFQKTSDLLEKMAKINYRPDPRDKFLDFARKVNRCNHCKAYGHSERNCFRKIIVNESGKLKSTIVDGFQELSVTLGAVDGKHKASQQSRDKAFEKPKNCPLKNIVSKGHLLFNVD